MPACSLAKASALALRAGLSDNFLTLAFGFLAAESPDLASFREPNFAFNASETLSLPTLGASVPSRGSRSFTLRNFASKALTLDASRLFTTFGAS